MRAFATVGLLLATLSLAAQTPLPTGQPPAPPGAPAGQDQPATWAAKLFDKENGNVPTGHNFGTVPKGALLQHRFTITNIYAVPLSISCEVSCNCVSVNPRSQVLQPKQTGVLDITMDTMRFNTQQKTVNVNVRVQHYDPRPQFWSDATLVIQGYRRDDIELMPAQASFGVVASGQQAARELQVRYHGGQPGWQITGAAADQALPFDVRYQEAFRQNGQAIYRVSLVLKPDSPAGSLKGEVNLATNDPNNPVVVVPYDVNVQAPLSILPSDSIRLGAVKVGGDASERKLYVRAGQPFHILGIDGQDGGVTAQVLRPDAALMTHILTVKVQATQVGPLQKTLTIRTDLGGGATATVKVDATAAQ
jgi:hypothetical protein